MHDVEDTLDQIINDFKGTESFLNDDDQPADMNQKITKPVREEIVIDPRHEEKLRI